MKVCTCLNRYRNRYRNDNYVKTESLLQMKVCIGHSGFGGIEVAWWPLVPKFVGSHPAEAVGFLR
jgi:hypothetical protein